MIPLDTPDGASVRLNLPVAEVEKFREDPARFHAFLDLDGSIVSVLGATLSGGLFMISAGGVTCLVEPAWLYPVSTDPELDLLNRLATEVPQDLYKQIDNSWTVVPTSYAEHPETVCSARNTGTGELPGQSVLGFLNQSRKARGLPVITMHSETDAQGALAKLWFTSEAR